MNFLLLIGAGFSRNWGGWLASEAFEYLLGAKGIDDFGRQLLWGHKSAGFEKALSVLQASNSPSLKGMEAAIRQMFEDMNRGFFANRQTFEFSNDRSNSVSQFLARFDAIFSLNQDLLLELGYCQVEPRQAISTRRVWSGLEFPGMHPRVQPAPLTPIPRWAGQQCPSGAMSVAATNSHTQPIYKLHGSSNWVDETGERLLVMGGDKTDAIKGSKVLTMYKTEFDRQLKQPNTRLMIIGYGFHDDHINLALDEAAEMGGLRSFIIDPAGADAPDEYRNRQNMLKKAGAQKKIQETLIGASRRGLQQIFGGDTIERDKVLRFFEA